MKKTHHKRILLLGGVVLLAACSRGLYANGRHIGSGFGERGVIMMEVNVEGGYVANLLVKESYDDRTAVQESYRLLRDELLREQSADSLTVNPVYPATSRAEIEAIREALDRAREAR